MPKVWDYGDAGDRFEVQDRDIWRIGPHRFVCGDLELGVGTALAAQAADLGKTPKMFYSDPPWDKGNARTFRTKAGVNTGPVDFKNLIRLVLQVASTVTGDVYCEMGAKHLPDMPELFTDAGIRLVTNWEGLYYNRLKCYLLMGSMDRKISDPLPAEMNAFSGMNDDDWPVLAMQMSSEPGDVVLETCLGLGATSRAAQATGRICVASELNPRRMAVSIAHLVDKCGLKAEKIGVW